MTALALLLTLAAFGCFGFATDEHHHRLTGRRPGSAAKRRWRAAAWFGLTLAFVAAIAGRGWIVGPILWAALVMLGAGAVFLLLNLFLRRGCVNQRSA